MKYTFPCLMLILTFLFACAGGGDSAGACGGSIRETRSVWVNSTGTETYDLRGITYGANKSIKWYPNTAFTGARCSCTVDVIGSQTAGAFNITACSYDAGTGAGDPGCAAHVALLYYANSNSTMTIGDENAVTVFSACYNSSCYPTGP